MHPSLTIAMAAIAVGAAVMGASLLAAGRRHGRHERGAVRQPREPGVHVPAAHAGGPATIAFAPDLQERYLADWRRLQTRFVDEPAWAARQADRLIAEMMRDRGYPIEDFERRAAGLPRADAQVVVDFRAARAAVAAAERSRASTEDLRRALLHYRSLFEELVQPGSPVGNGTPSHHHPRRPTR